MPRNLPRGTDWMPSSPPVNGACSAVEEHHLRERERDHREIDALAADREQRRPRSPARVAAAVPVRIASSVGNPQTLAACAERYPAMPRNMACPKDSRPPNPSSRLKAQAKSAKHSGLHQEDGIENERRHDEQREHHDEAVAVIARFPGGIVVLGAAGLVIAHRCPNRPWGRIMRTIAMITKITVLDASG